MKTYKSLDEAVQHVKQVEKDIEKKLEKNLHRLQKKAKSTLKRQQRELRKSKLPTYAVRPLLVESVSRVAGLRSPICLTMQKKTTWAAVKPSQYKRPATK